MEINLSGDKTINIVPAENVITSKVTIDRLVDLPTEKVVFAVTREIGRINLWVGEEYDAIGQWTNDDVETRILDLYNN